MPERVERLTTTAFLPWPRCRRASSLATRSARRAVWRTPCSGAFQSATATPALRVTRLPNVSGCMKRWRNTRQTRAHGVERKKRQDVVAARVDELPQVVLDHVVQRTARERSLPSRDLRLKRRADPTRNAIELGEPLMRSVQPRAHVVDVERDDGVVGGGLVVAGHRSEFVLALFEGSRRAWDGTRRGRRDPEGRCRRRRTASTARCRRARAEACLGRAHRVRGPGCQAGRTSTADGRRRTAECH